MCWALGLVLQLLCLTYPFLQQPWEGGTVGFFFFHTPDEDKKKVLACSRCSSLLSDHMSPNP